jgi:Tfp pilus assembly protein PilN
MTTTLPPEAPPQAAENALRVPELAADLLPVEIVDARRARKVRRAVLLGLLVFAVLLAGACVATRQRTADARETLDNAQADVQRVRNQQRAFADVVSVQAEARQVVTQLGTLFHDDLQWAPILHAVRAVAPTGISLDSVSSAAAATAVGAGPATAPAAAAPAAGGSSADSLSTLTITGYTTGKVAVASYMDALAQIPGLGRPTLVNFSENDNKLRFTVQVNIAASALGGRYTLPGTTRSGTN